MKSALFLLFAPVLLAGDAKQRESVVHRLPALSAVFPPGAEPGAKVRVELLGDYLDRAQAVVFVGRGMAGAGEGSVGAQTSEAPIRARIVESRFTRLILDLEIGVNAAFGEHYFRVVTPRGPSNIALFRVGDQPHVLEKEPNSTLEQAMPVRLPVTLNARLERDGDFDFFRFHAHAGETWVFDLRSARNGNSLDAGLMLLDENGKRVAHSEDVFIWDPFLVHRFDGGGTFYAVVQGTHRNNDPSFAYQLDVRRAAHLQTISPLSFVPGAAAEATIYGAALLDGGAKLVFDTARIRGTITGAHGDRASAQLEVDAGLAPGAYRFWIAGKDGRSNAVTLLVADTPRAGDAQNLRPPASIAGVARYREPERFSFEAKAGETLVFEGRAQRYGSPADLILRIRNTSGKTVATNDDGNFPGVQFNKDPYLVHKFKEHGRYTLEVRNLVATSGENFPYELVMRRPAPQVELMLASDQPYVHPGEEGSIKLTASRREDYEGAIALGPRTGGLIALAPSEIPAGKNEGAVAVDATQLKPGSFEQVEVLGPDGRRAWRSVRLSSGGGEGATFARVDTATLAVAEKANFSLECDATTVNVVRGEAAEIPVLIRRAPGFDSEIRFSLENLPEGVTIESGVAGRGEGSAQIRLRASKEARRGRYARVAVLGTSAEGRTEQAPRIVMVVN